jgi:hypothetical protein
MYFFASAEDKDQNASFALSSTLSVYLSTILITPSQR